MKIAIVNLTGGGLSGGYRKYLRHLTPVLKSGNKGSSPIFFVHEALRDTPGLEHVEVRCWPARDHLFGYRRLKAALRALAPDVVFIPSARWIDLGVIPTVVMVRNMEPLEVPFGENPLLEKLKNVVRAREARNACRCATRVIAVSQHVKDFLVSRWSIPAERVGLVYHGIDRVEPVPESAKPPALPPSIQDFIFTAGSIRPARGLEDLVGALGRLAQQGERHPVVIAGAVDAGMAACKRKLDVMARRLGVFDRIAWAGPLSAAQMSWCYDHCRLFVMTTRAEACPNTALEAMAHGCHAVVTDKAPLPEFFENSALYYRAGDPNSLANGIAKALGTGVQERARLQEAARARAAAFQWNQTAQRTLDELLRAARTR